MADISLRAYLKEIDELIERDQLDAAIAHCRHILQIYPKHLDTYRLLGKSYLEAKRFGDAADIFQRVLSAVPDDFVSHIGMAIVREDEGNMDAAIWHMERAFETNPANPAIRQELSRLIGRRDGIEPHKIRLTRGALARQYAQGELYPQAIAELRSALQEDPDRPELEVLLAKMYWRSGQAGEARSISKQILEKLPFSFEANRILAALYESEGQSDKAGEYHRRLAALEPYAAFSDASSIDPTSVDSNAVRIDHSDWIPGHPLPSGEPSQPDWVASLGVDLTLDESEVAVSDASPSWLSEIENAIPTTGDAQQALMNSELPHEDADQATPEPGIPSWMEEAGWGPSSGEAEEGPVSFSEAELESLDSGIPAPEISDDGGELAPTEIPSWLQGKAPQQAVEGIEHREEPQTVEESDGIMPDWLSEIADEAEDISPDPGGEEPESDDPPPLKEKVHTTAAETPTEDESPEVPSWIDDLSPGATSTIITWLGDRPEIETGSEESVPASTPEVVPSRATTDGDLKADDIPSWLDNLAEGDEVPDLDSGLTQSTPDAAPVKTSTPPSWLAGVAEAASQQSAAVEKPAATPIEDEPATPASEDDWLQNLRAAEAQAEPLEEDTGEAPDWLDGIAESEASDADAEEPGTPDWLRGVREPADLGTEASTSRTTEAPDWLKAEDELEPQPGTVKPEVPSWLRGIADQSPETTDIDDDLSAFDARESHAKEDPPDWLQDFAGEAETSTERLADEEPLDPQTIQEIEAELSAATEPAGDDQGSTPAGIGAEDDLDDEEVFRWLESLADRQEADEATPTLTPDTVRAGGGEQATPEMRQTVPPEEPEASLQWLEDLAAERGLDLDITPEMGPQTLEAPEPTAASKPAATPEATPASTPEAIEEASPDWLREMATAPSDETHISIPRPPVTDPAPSPTVEQPIEPELTKPVAAAPPTPFEQELPEIPSWLDEATSVAAGVPAEPPSQPEKAPDEKPAVPSQPPTQPVQPPAAVVAETPVPAPKIEKPVPVESNPTPIEAPAVEAQPGAVGKPGKPGAYKEPPTEAEILLKGARQALAAGDAGRALSDYKKMIKRKQDLDTVIEDLEEALDRYPNLPTMWQTLGDAFMKADRLAEAIQAYQRGMEVA